MRNTGFGLGTWNFRFRGKVNRLLAIVDCFMEDPGQGLHPTQIAKRTSMTMLDVIERLDATPELFVRLPGRRDGVTRYRLLSSVATLDFEAVETIVLEHAKKEDYVYYAFIIMLILLLGIMVMVFIPALPLVTDGSFFSDSAE